MIWSPLDHETAAEFHRALLEQAADETMENPDE